MIASSLNNDDLSVELWCKPYEHLDNEMSQRLDNHIQAIKTIFW